MPPCLAPAFNRQDEKAFGLQHVLKKTLYFLLSRVLKELLRAYLIKKNNNKEILLCLECFLNLPAVQATFLFLLEDLHKLL